MSGLPDLMQSKVQLIIVSVYLAVFSVSLQINTVHKNKSNAPEAHNRIETCIIVNNNNKVSMFDKSVYQ